MVNRIVEKIRGRVLGGPIRRYYKLKTAYSMLGELLPCASLDDALKIILNRVAHSMRVEIVSIMLVDNDRKRLIIKIAKGLNEEIVKDAATAIGEGVSGWVGKTGQPLLIKDITKDQRFVLRSLNNKYYNNSLLSVPLKMQDRISGVINVNNKISKGIFREYDLDLLNTIANIAAIAIENIRLQEDLKRINETSYELVSNVSHELKTPLTIIKEAVSLMLEGHSGDITEKQKKYLELSRQNVDRLNRLINAYTESAKAVQGKLLLHRSLFDITGTLKNVMDSLDILAKEKGIVLKGAIPDKKVEIWGDPDKLNQVISNLVDNAIKYNKQQGKVELALDDKDTSVVISVTDTGIGIPHGEINKIFDRFYRAESAFKEGINGTGLGLSIVRDIVDMHKGEVLVESEPDKGTKFTVVLPKSLRK